MIAPMIQPNMACGPAMAATIAGIVTNGPMPHIWVMLIAVAWTGPMLRSKPVVWVGELMARLPRLLRKFPNIDLTLGEGPGPYAVGTC